MGGGGLLKLLVTRLPWWGVCGYLFVFVLFVLFVLFSFVGMSVLLM